jgi:hypothetical protein
VIPGFKPGVDFRKAFCYNIIQGKNLRYPAKTEMTKKLNKNLKIGGNT